MPNEISLIRLNSLKPHFLIPGAKLTFGQIFKKITRSKKIEVVWIKRPNPNQMTAVLAARMIGKRFVWMQSFENPPVPGFYTRLLLTQPDRLIVPSYKEVKKLLSFGVKRGKIKVETT